MNAPVASILFLPTVPSAAERYYLNAVETG
jgi:hypothetical protein